MKDECLRGRADLHNHTTASDGLLTPTQLIRFAALKRLNAVAITDHDSTNGIQEGISAGNFYHVEIIPGIELNTQMNSDEIHILGYFIDWNSIYLQNTLVEMREIRKNRAKKIVSKLIDLYGFNISYDEVLSEAKGGAVARPHIARVLMSKGIVKSVSEAFEKYIGTSCPAYVGRYHLTPKEGIDLIEKCGGVPVLAHPGLLMNPDTVDKIIEYGVKGIEAYHSKHNEDQSRYYAYLAEQNNLLITGGSDCHGELYEGIPIIGDVTICMDVVEKLKYISKGTKLHE